MTSSEERELVTGLFADLAGYNQALARADELGPLTAHCHLGLGTLYRQMGDRAKVHEHLTTAATMYREMDMGFWLEQAKAFISAPVSAPD